MDKFVKYQSQQGGNFNRNQNLVDFVLPEGQTYNLHDSYINLNVICTVEEEETASGTGIYPVSLKWTTDGGSTAQKNHFDNVSLVKNASMRCRNKGQLENIRRVDILRQNLKNYTRSQRELLSGLDHKNANVVVSPIQKSKLGIFRDFNKVQANNTGSIKSRDLTILPVQIPLKEIFEICNTQEFNATSSGCGETRIHLELNADRLMCIQTNNTIQTSYQDCQDISSTGNFNQIVTDYTVDSLRQIAFWVGQKVVVAGTGTITWTHQKGSTQSGYGVVSAVQWVQDSSDPNYRKVVVSFEDNIGNVTSGTLADVKVTQALVNSASLEISQAEIVVKEVANPEGYDSISYNTYSTEQANGNKLINFQRQFQCEPECTNVFVFFPSSDDGLNSVNDNLESFRLRIDNMDATDRDIQVEPKDALYYDRISMTLSNAQMELKNLQEAVPDSSVTDWSTVFDNQELTSIMNPTPMTEREKLLQVNIQGKGDGVEEIALFKQIPRQLVY